MKHRTYKDVLKISDNLKELEKQFKKIKNCKDVNEKTEFLLDVRREIVDGIEAGNYYDFVDAVNIADHFGLAQCNWSEYGCPLMDCDPEET